MNGRFPLLQAEPPASATSDLTRTVPSALSESQQFGQPEVFETDPYMMLLDDDPLDSFPRAQDEFFEDFAAVSTFFRSFLTFDDG